MRHQAVGLDCSQGFTAESFARRDVQCELLVPEHGPELPEEGRLIGLVPVHGSGLHVRKRDYSPEPTFEVFRGINPVVVLLWDLFNRIRCSGRGVAEDASVPSRTCSAGRSAPSGKTIGSTVLFEPMDRAIQLDLTLQGIYQCLDLGFMQTHDRTKNRLDRL